ATSNVLLCRFKFCVAGFELKIFSLQKSATQSVTHDTIELNALIFFLFVSHIAIDTLFSD
ncbi:hypothetical protein ACIEGM_16285, partial [Citrobacter freundii]|uniref:hypothetical protein n=1 Tax=Citrobacter freundii TaxID=546 RepID=UPI0037CBF7D1